MGTCCLTFLNFSFLIHQLKLEHNTLKLPWKSRGNNTIKHTPWSVASTSKKKEGRRRKRRMYRSHFKKSTWFWFTVLSNQKCYCKINSWGSIAKRVKKVGRVIPWNFTLPCRVEINLSAGSPMKRILFHDPVFGKHLVNF